MGIGKVSANSLVGRYQTAVNEYCNNGIENSVGDRCLKYLIVPIISQLGATIIAAVDLAICIFALPIYCCSKQHLINIASLIITVVISPFLFFVNFCYKKNIPIDYLRPYLCFNYDDLFLKCGIFRYSPSYMRNNSSTATDDTNDAISKLVTLQNDESISLTNKEKVVLALLQLDGSAKYLAFDFIAHGDPDLNRCTNKDIFEIMLSKDGIFHTLFLKNLKSAQKNWLKILENLVQKSQKNEKLQLLLWECLQCTDLEINKWRLETVEVFLRNGMPLPKISSSGIYQADSEDSKRAFIDALKICIEHELPRLFKLIYPEGNKKFQNTSEVVKLVLHEKKTNNSISMFITMVLDCFFAETGFLYSATHFVPGENERIKKLLSTFEFLAMRSQKNEHLQKVVWECLQCTDITINKWRLQGVEVALRNNVPLPEISSSGIYIANSEDSKRALIHALEICIEQDLPHLFKLIYQEGREKFQKSLKEIDLVALSKKASTESQWKMLDQLIDEADFQVLSIKEKMDRHDHEALSVKSQKIEKANKIFERAAETNQISLVLKLINCVDKWAVIYGLKNAAKQGHEDLVKYLLHYSRSFKWSLHFYNESLANASNHPAIKILNIFLENNIGPFLEIYSFENREEWEKSKHLYMAFAHQRNSKDSRELVISRLLWNGLSIPYKATEVNLNHSWEDPSEDFNNDYSEELAKCRQIAEGYFKTIASTMDDVFRELSGGEQWSKGKDSVWPMALSDLVAEYLIYRDTTEKTRNNVQKALEETFLYCDLSESQFNTTINTITSYLPDTEFWPTQEAIAASA